LGLFLDIWDYVLVLVSLFFCIIPTRHQKATS
jgi:hypothetical protein